MLNFGYPVCNLEMHFPAARARAHVRVSGGVCIGSSGVRVGWNSYFWARYVSNEYVHELVMGANVCEWVHVVKVEQCGHVTLVDIK